jgi:hypothetical protein
MGEARIIVETYSFGLKEVGKWLGAAVFLHCVTTGCGGAVVNEENHSVVEKRILIAQPCETLDADAVEKTQPFEQVFIEVADVAPSAIPRPINDWLTRNPVEVDWVTSIRTDSGVPFKFNIGRKGDNGGQLSAVITATLPEKRAEPIAMSVQLIEESESERIVGEKSLTTDHQKPTVVDFTAKEGSTDALTFVITPYLLDGEKSLKKLLSCKQGRSSITPSTPSNPKTLQETGSDPNRHELEFSE